MTYTEQQNHTDSNLNPTPTTELNWHAPTLHRFSTEYAQSGLTPDGGSS